MEMKQMQLIKIAADNNVHTSNLVYSFYRIETRIIVCCYEHMTEK